jgi:hypothetical protein
MVVVFTSNRDYVDGKRQQGQDGLRSRVSVGIARFPQRDVQPKQDRGQDGTEHVIWANCRNGIAIQRSRIPR